MKKRLIGQWATATITLFVLCSFINFCEKNGLSPSTPKCEPEGTMNITFSRISLRVPFNEIPFDQNFFSWYHQISIEHPIIEDIYQLINHQEYNSLPEKQRSYINISLESSECTGAVTQHFSHPDSLGANTLIGITHMKTFIPDRIHYYASTALSPNKYKIGWNVTKDYMSQQELTAEGEFTENNTFNVPDVSVPGLVMKQISIDDPDFPVAPGTGILIGGDLDFGKDIDMN